MTSIFENTTSKVTVHILHDDTLTDDNRLKFIRTAEKYSQALDFVDVTEHAKRIDTKTAEFVADKWTVGCMYRLLAPELLSLDKVIYLDCDIVVNLDLQDMWNIDVEDYCLAGVHSAGFENLPEALRDHLNGSSCKTYVNSGVLIMNLDKIRENGNLYDKSIEYHIKRRHLIYMSDQDTLNALFYGSIKLIDRKYNNANPVTWEQLPDSIIHTPHPVYAYKTWGTRGLPSQKLYWKYYARSAWCEGKSPEELAEVFNDAAEKSVKSVPYEHRTRQYAAEILRRIARKVFCNNAPAKIIRYLVLEAYYRVTHMFTRS